MKIYGHHSYFCIPLCHNEFASTSKDRFGMVESFGIEAQIYGVQVVRSEMDGLFDEIFDDLHELNETKCGIIHNVERIPLHEF